MRRKEMCRMDSVIISGGGTGGHIFPAVAIADEIKRRYPNCNIHFVGALGRMEMEKVPAAGYAITGLPISGFQRKQLWKNWNLPFKIIRSLIISNQLLKKHKPQLVVGVGGYASAAITKRAQAKGIKTLLQEQNGYAGMTNKILGKNADAICVAYENMSRFFPVDKIHITGNPIRESILKMGVAKPEWYTKYGLSNDKPVLLVVGGSLGARSINKAVESALDILIENGVQVIWQTGKNYQHTYQKKAGDGVSIQNFIKEMHEVYSLADLIVSRAGALSISELCYVGKPTIFVPSPNVAEDHQTKNALAMVDKKAAVLVSDSEVNNVLLEKVIGLINDNVRTTELAMHIKSLAKPNAVNDIVDIAENLNQ